jgi:hypothetical protein
MMGKEGESNPALDLEDGIQSATEAVDMAVSCEVSHEYLSLFQSVARLYQAGIMVLDKQSLADPALALAQFLEGYAFERQGRSPAYAPIARNAFEAAATTGDFWLEKEMPQRVWQSFCSTLKELREDARPNPMNNPLCPQGQSHITKWGQKVTSQTSVLQFVQQKLKEYDHNIVAWAACMLQGGQVQSLHGELCSINGIGPKIASFFLRDIAWCFGIQIASHRELLQPVDVWVDRTVRQLDATARGDEATWIVRESRAAGVLPEAVNAGLWYFGALIAGSEFRLFEAMNNRQLARFLVNEYVARLQRQADAWSQE